MPPKKKTDAEAAPAPTADVPKEVKAKKPAKEPKEPKEVTEPTRRSTRIKDLPPKPDPATTGLGPAKKKKRGDNKNDPDAQEYRPGGASARKGAGKKRKKAAAKEDGDDDEAEEEAQPKKKVKSEAKAAEAEDTKMDAAAAESSKHIITVGSVLPNLVLKNEKGEDVQVADLAKESGVIIFAIPKADTPGCNKQACHYRDNYSDIQKLGYAVYALSADAGTAQSKWQSKHNLPYSMLSDPNRVLIEQLGAKKSANATTRSHFIFEKGTGKLLQAQINVSADASHKLALEYIKGL